MSLQGNATADSVLRGKINPIDTLVVDAYDIAVKHGFKGTEEEWLESLAEEATEKAAEYADKSAEYASQAADDAASAEEDRIMAEKARDEAEVYTAQHIDKWLTDHPEVTTTVQDGSLTEDKFSDALKIVAIKDYVTPQMFGAKGDGVTDDSEAIRKAIASLPDANFVLVFPKGVYRHGSGGDNGDISFEFNNKKNFKVSGYGATIISDPQNSCVPNNKIFKFVKCEHGVIEGLTIDGNKNNRKPAGGDASGYNDQNNLALYGCKYITIQDVQSINSVMDGFLICGTGENKTTDYVYSEYITMTNCKADNAYRQGMSCVNAHYGIVTGCEFSKTGKDYGTSPMAGVDMEQGYSGYLDVGQKGWSFNNCRFVDNEGSGLALHWGTYNAIVKDCYFEDSGIFIPYDSEGHTRDNTVRDCQFKNCGINADGGGLLFENNSMTNGSLTVTDSLGWYAAGVSRRNIISGNKIVYDWEIDESTQYSGKWVAEQRRCGILSGDGLIYTRNEIINGSGQLMLSCVNPIAEISYNTIKSTLIPADGYYLGELYQGINAQNIHDNIVVGAYATYNNGGTYVESLNPDRNKATLIVNKVQDSKAIEVVCPFLPNIVEIESKGGTIYRLNHITVNTYSVSRVSGNNTDLQITKFYICADGLYRMYIKAPNHSCNKITVYALQNNILSDQIITAQFNDVLAELSPQYEVPFTNGVWLNALPSSSKYTFSRGDTFMYNTKPVWYYSGKWYYADGTTAT